MAGPKLRAFRSRAVMVALGIAATVFRRLPLRAGRLAGRALGTLAWYVSRRDRKRALKNIAIAFPEWTERQRRKTIRGMFRHMGMSIFEIAWLPNLNQSNLHELTVVDGAEAVVKHVQAGGSLIAITGHCGNWEWLAATVGLHVPLTTLQRVRIEPGLNEFVRKTRLHAGVQTIDRGSPSSAREMIQALKKPGVLAFLIDQAIRAESVSIPFFGRPALTVIGPARLAVRGSLPLLPIFVQRLPDGRQHVRFVTPVATKPDDDPVALTAAMTELIEEHIRRAPEQWVWIHDRWKYRAKWDVENAS